MALAKLLGDKVVKLEGEELVDVEVSSLEGEGKVVGIYFSAHWCPPCRAFTPLMVKWYKRLRDGIVGDKLNVVFASSDRDEESFKEYFKSMSWLALPYSMRDKKAELSKKYKVAGIPTLVLVDASNGKLITTDGRSVVMEDDTGKDFPWIPKPFLEVVSSGGLVKGPKGKEVDSEAIKGKILGVYFSATWCAPCRTFTPVLKEIYEKLKKEGKNFEILFVSSDKDENQYKNYLKEMPWIAIPYGDSRKKKLSRTFRIQGIPTLVIVDENGEVINAGGRAAINDDPEGAEFPWYPKPVRPLTESSAADINEFASLMWINKDMSNEDLVKIVEPIATPRIDEKKAVGEDPMMFYVLGGDGESGDIEKSLRKFAKLGDKTPLLVIFDIPEQKLYVSDAEDLNADTVKQFVDGYYNKSISHLERRLR